MEEKETWLPIPGQDGFSASSLGRIRREFDQRILKPDYRGRKQDYPRVCLRANRKKRGVTQKGIRKAVHIFVARAFIGFCPEGMEHNHKDGDKTNARPDNLEFVTRSQNQQHAMHVLGERPGRQGTEHGMCKLTESDVHGIRQMRTEGHQIATIAAHYKVHTSRVSWICRGRGWKHLKLTDLGRIRVTQHSAPPGK